MTLKELIVLLKLNSEDFKRGINEANNEVGKFSQSSSQVGNIANNVFSLITKTVIATTASITGITWQTARFQDNLFLAWKQASDGALASGREYDKFSQKAYELSRGTTFSANQIAMAFKLVADNARNAAQTQEEVAWAQKLATATGTDLLTTSKAVSDSLRIFGEKGLTSTQATNYLYTAMIKGTVGLNELQIAFGTLFPLAAQVGWSFKDLLTIITTLSNKVGGGYRAIFALQSILDAAREPSSALGKALVDVGISLTDSEGKVRPLIDIIKDLQSNGKKLEGTFKNFGPMMELVATALVNSGKEMTDINLAMTNSVLGTTKVQKDAEERSKTLTGTLETLRSTFANLFTDTGTFSKELAPLINLFTEWITKIIDVIKSTNLLGITFKVLKEATKPIQDSIEIIIRNFTDWVKNIKPGDVVNFFTAIGDAINEVSKFAGRFLLALEQIAKTLTDIVGMIPRMSKIPGLRMLTPGGVAKGTAEDMWEEFRLKEQKKISAKEVSKVDWNTLQQKIWEDFQKQFKEENKPSAISRQLKTLGFKPGNEPGSFEEYKSEFYTENRPKMQMDTDFAKKLREKLSYQGKYTSTEEQKISSMQQYLSNIESMYTEQLKSSNQVVIDFYGETNKITASSVEELKQKLQNKFDEFKKAMNPPKTVDSLM